MTFPTLNLDDEALDAAQAINQQVRALINAASACMNGPGGDLTDVGTLLELAYDRTKELDRIINLVSRLEPSIRLVEPFDGEGFGGRGSPGKE